MRRFQPEEIEISKQIVLRASKGFKEHASGRPFECNDYDNNAMEFKISVEKQF